MKKAIYILEEDNLDIDYEEDIYTVQDNTFYDEELEDDEICMEEEAFMQGYLAA